MNKHTFRQDIREFMDQSGIGLRDFAHEVGLNPSILSRFLKRDDANITTDSFFLIWKHLYGEQTPVPLHVLEQVQGNKEARQEVNA